MSEPLPGSESQPPPEFEAAIETLYVDAPESTDPLAASLEREHDCIEVTTAGSVDAALETVVDGAVDCVVAEYDLPDGTGIELLEAVRSHDGDLPFILSTDDGSEAVASEGISAGVTDYVPKQTDDDQATLLAHRIEQAVSQYRAQRSAARQRKLLETQADAMEASIDGVAILDEDGRYEYVNRAHVSVYGYEDAEQFLGEPWQLCYRDEEVRRFEREVMPELESSGGWRGEAEGLRADGSTFPQELSLSTTDGGGLVCVVRDITDRKERERRIREQTRQLRAVLDTTSANIFMKNVDGEYVLLNDECAETLGLEDPSEAIGRTDYDLVPEAVAEQYRADDRRVLERGEPIEVEEQIPTADGERTFLTFKNPVYDEDGEPVGVCAVSSDVSALKERERELERERDRLEEFADIVSHDLRNPLNVASGALALLAEETDSEYVDTVARAHERMDALIEDLLALATEGRTVDDPEPVDLESVASSAWRNVETDAATLSVSTDATVLADRSRLQQLLENLVRNAVTHAAEEPDASDLTVAVGSLEGDGAGGSGFYVADDGPGIPADERADVLRAGYSTRDDGTGFGLSIVAQIAEAHGWTVDVTDSADGGARFTVTGVEHPT